MLTNSQLKIFEPLTRNMLKEYSIKEIKELSGEKSNNALSLALKKFKEENLINERKVPKPALRAIERIKEDIDKHTSFFSIVIFGSYSIGKQTKYSDLDVAVFIEEESNRKIIESALKSSELKTPLQIHGHVISKDEFLEMLKVDEENLGKQIARKHLSIYNSHIFYSLLKKGVKNGFRY